MTATAFDVVVVSDFRDEVSRRFEIITLFFLASWLEYGGRSRDLPLHIACIDEPPESVLSLGASCNAEITIHEPLLFGGFANKLRGFEVNSRTDNLLLLDSDMLVLSEISDLPAILGKDCLSAAPANGPCIVPPKQWIQIHKMLGVPYPTTQVNPLNFELDTFQCAPYRDRIDFPPYYNGGIVFSPWKSKLGDVWLDHLKKISEVGKRKAKTSNQPPLATAITLLQNQGFKFQLLPPEFHVRWQHITTGAVTSANTRLLHTIGFGRWLSKGNSNSAKREIEIYLQNMLELTRKTYSHKSPVSRYFREINQNRRLRDCHRVYNLLENLYEKHVRVFKA